MPVEEAGGKEVLVRCKQWVFGRQTPPDWLMESISCLEITEETAIKEQREREEEADRLVSEDLFMDNRIVSSGVTPNAFRDEFFSHLDCFREAVALPNKEIIDDELLEIADKLF